MTSTQGAVEQIVEQFFAALGANDVAALAQLVRDDVIWTLMTSGETDSYRACGFDAAVAQFMKGGESIFRTGDPKTRVVSIIADDNRAMAETIGSGERKDGKAYAAVYAWAFEFSNGLVAQVREYTDTAYAERFFDMSN